ncbi:MAG: hypothetical protein AB8H03_03140 [Saprospiraceae bacterium]
MSNKPLISGFEKIILLGLVVFFGYGIYKNGGISMYEKSEETTIFDGKTSANTYRDLDEKEIESNWNRKGATTPKKAKEEKLNTDDVLGKLARTFSAGRKETARQMKEMGLTDDEINHVNNIKKENELSDQLQDARDWFNILKTSASTYGKVKSFVDDLSNGAGGDENVNALLQDDKRSTDFYKNLESTFGISESEAKAFSTLGKKKVSDWAKFIEEKGKQN